MFAAFLFLLSINMPAVELAEYDCTGREEDSALMIWDASHCGNGQGVDWISFTGAEPMRFDR